MPKKLGCLHAHYSNIDYIESLFTSYDIECIHFVDPALMYQVTENESFTVEDAQKKVKEQIEWITKSNIDAILITCTNYIALLQEEKLSVSVPIIKIDEPFFEYICNIQQPQIMLFTNPATVNGTMNRLKQYADLYGKSIDVQANVINNSFELIMKGFKKEYNQLILTYLNELIDEEKILSVAQLSMVDASREVEARLIINPLDTLVTSIINQLNLEM